MVARNQEGLQIGEVLRSTRSRLGMDIVAVERATKIRTKYLQALEDEDWDVLPGPTYVKGFLRTYAGYHDRALSRRRAAVSVLRAAAGATPPSD
jgi:hypothetical protein